ncbi:aspartate aminotransferase [Bacillus sp. FJAT-27916]|uniref:pyridoxal phosphate-dependent aminotransferase n=1 Tax=Bacillaceae TaxID=186817 RepID=UPI000670F062|nr:pyridoxal phosphate-dependent aminotransferase [Bacillus sp. FJAT-27916]KMY44197.1 aspartate aminotransferase [Bacillus sp. FJAT-27916]
MKLAKRVAALTPSSTLAITAKAKELKAQGLDVIGLGAGEPDFNTPVNILEAAKKSMDEGQTKYTPSAGLPSLRNSVADKLKRDQGLDYKANEIFIGSGAKHALYTLFQAILDEGDEVLIPTPYWVSYPEQVKLADGTPVYIEGKEENEFKITPEQIKASVSDRTKAIILNSPSNPTGMIYSPEELQAIGDVCLENDILIVSDEIYEKLVYHGSKHVSIAQLSPELKKQTIIINGVSKSHSMTGWRIGYAAGDEAIIKAMTNLASHSTSNPTTTAQYAAIEAYNGPQEAVQEMRNAFEKRLEAIYDRLLEIPGLTCIKPKGAFYLFPNVSKTAQLAGYNDVDDFAAGLLENALVAVVPGSGFGAPKNIRLSYATSEAALSEAVKRMKKYVEERMQQS